MSCDQLYFPNLHPQITARLAVSLLHWDRVVRIYPREGTADFRPRRGVMHDLEEAGILVGKPATQRVVRDTGEWFRELAALAHGPKGAERSYAFGLLEPLANCHQDPLSMIYAGKAIYELDLDHPRYFTRGTDSNGNDVFFCTKRTALTYMTGLAHYFNHADKYATTITDSCDAHELNIAFHSLPAFDARGKARDIVSAVETTELVERVFFMPLFAALEPAQFEGDTTLERILTFRQNAENEESRKRYMGRIAGFVQEMSQCDGDADIRDLVSKHEGDLRADLDVLISACERHRIPVDRRLIVHADMGGWSTVARLWDTAWTVGALIKAPVVSILKAAGEHAVKAKPAIDYYNSVVIRNQCAYPILVQQTFGPKTAQRAFARMRSLNQVHLRLRFGH